MDDRVKTGIHGLDDLMEGGIPRNHVVLLSGQAGSGKTLFGLQFLSEGAISYGEKGCFITFEQRKEDVIEQAKRFGWDLERLSREGKFSLLSYFGTRKHASAIFEEICNHIDAEKPHRVVLDSLSTFIFHLDLMTAMEMLEMMQIEAKNASFLPSSDAITRRTIIEIISKLKSTGATTLLISEIPEESEFLSRDTVSEYLADGVILLHYLPIGGETFSNIQVRKMRGTIHKKELFNTEIHSRKGIVVKTDSGSSISLR